jgi:hypothetical protein
MRPEVLYHFSVEHDIARFEPRFSELAGARVVWAVDAEHAHLYLFPRDCPRVTYYAGPQTIDSDRERFLGLGTSSRVVAIEAAWLAKMRETRLYRYEFSSEGFDSHNEGAGYWLARKSVEPTRVEALGDLLTELASLHVEVRMMPSLWPLYEAVIASSLQFSIIRWRNAAPRPDVATRRFA